jgi:FkbM family methyltransferase
MRKTLLKIYSRAVRLLPIAGGQTYISFNKLTRWLYHQHPSPCKVQLRSGHAIDVDVHDHDGRVLHIFGIGDIKVGDLTQALLRDGDWFLDVGANYGSIGLGAARCVGSKGTVHFLEPLPNLAAAIRDAIRRDGEPNNLHVLEAAASDRPGRMTLHFDPRHSGVASLVPNPRSTRRWMTLEVPVLDIGALINQCTPDTTFGVKLDIEGHEPTVLPVLLSHPACRFVIFEASSNAHTLFDICFDAGFLLFGLRRLHFRRSLARIDRPDSMSLFHDVLAVPRHRLTRESPRTCSFSRFAKLLA